MFNLNVGIFIPIYFRDELVEKCLTSLATSNFNYKSLKVFLCLGINGASEKFKNDFLTDYIKKYNKTLFSDIYIYDQNKNLGKPKIINEMAKKWSNFNYLVSMDSDMQTTDPFWLSKLLKIFYFYKNPRPLGALCTNQSGHSVHTVTSYEHMKIKVDEHILITSKNNIGVAGGVLMTPEGVWKKIGGYTTYDIYGSDDGTYALECRKINYIMALVEDVYFNHPLTEDNEYSHWKLRASQGSLQENEKEGFFEKHRK